MNGLRVVIDDDVRTQAWRIHVESPLALLVLELFMGSTVILITFQPVAGSFGLHSISRLY
jgi:succinate dehydrogenase hydrophobic anchor subunit